MAEAAAEGILTFSPPDKAARKVLFAKMTAEAQKYEEPDQLLQAKVVLNMCFEIKANVFSSTIKSMVKMLKFYGDYHEPVGKETLRSTALKVTNKLASCLRESPFAALLKRAAELSLTVVTSRTVPAPEEEIDLSEEEDIPFSTNTTFTSHRITTWYFKFPNPTFMI